MFWPSLLMTGGMWPAQAQYFSRDHRGILVDPPGHGESGSLTSLFTFDECAQSIADILDRLGARRTHVVGNSRRADELHGLAAVRIPALEDPATVNRKGTPARLIPVSTEVVHIEVERDDGIVVAAAGELAAGAEDKAREAVKLCPASALRLA